MPPQFHQWLVSCVHVDQAESRVVEIEDGVDRDREQGRIGDDVEPAALPAFGHRIPRQQATQDGGTDQRIRIKPGRCVSMLTRNAVPEIDHLVDRRNHRVPPVAGADAVAATDMFQMACWAASTVASSRPARSESPRCS